MRIRYLALLRDFTGKKEEVWREPASCVGALIDALVKRYGRNFERWVRKDGKMWGLVLIMVNGQDIRMGDGFETPLSPDDEVVIFPPVGGG